MKMILVLALVLASGLAVAEDVLSVNLEVGKDDSAYLIDARVTEGRPTAYTTPGDYSLRVLDLSGSELYSQSIRLNFMVMTDPPRPVDKQSIVLRIPFQKTMSELVLEHGGIEIFRQKLDLCDGDGICSDHETISSCPQDCSPGEVDRSCIPLEDGACDPDCSEGVDPDCPVCGDGTCAHLEDCEADCSLDPCVEDGICRSCKDDPDCRKPSMPFMIPAIAIIIILLLGLMMLRRIHR